MIPIKCADLELEVPRLQRKPWRFLFRVLFALALLAGGVVMTLSGDWRLVTAGVIVEGLLFTHLLELVHSCIHGTAFGSQRVDRLAGVLLGLPMLVSYSDYRDNHLEHHRTLGVTEKKDFFGYEFDAMTTWQSFAKHLTMSGHYINAIKTMLKSIAPWEWWRIPSEKVNARLEHLLMLVWLLVPLVLLASGHSKFLLVIVVPLLIAVPVHVLVELPEHYHCRPVDNPLTHTRSIAANRVAVWFTNGNNYHFEHHLCPWLPNNALKEVQLKLHPHIVHYHPSYFNFYSHVFRSLRFTNKSI